MTHLKHYASENELRYIVAYADNNATKFFRKQGFIDQHELPILDPISHVIEYFTSATLMGCKIYEEINYLNLKETLEQQLSVLVDECKENNLIGVIELEDPNSFEFLD
jgi:hypothetical protein